MPKLPLPRYLQEYAGSKAEGEMYLRGQNSPSLLTVAVAPHQVYGPRDNLFLPNIMEAAGSGRLRIFSKPSTDNGFNRVCFTHVDNYCHGLIIAEAKLFPGSPCCGKFYIVTDGSTHPDPRGFSYFWVMVDQASRELGFGSLFAKAKLPTWLLFPVARVAETVGKLRGFTTKLNVFNVLVLTMHRWFNIDAAEKELG